MICPRCRKEILEQDIVCKHCGLKLKIICPRCKEPDKFGQPVCKKCGLTFIRFCPECKTPNFPHVKNCRKCSFELLKKKSGVKTAKTVKIKQVLKEDSLSQPSKKEEEKIHIPEIQETKPEEKNEKDEKKESPEIIDFKKELTRNETVSFLAETITKSEKGYIASICAPDGLGKSTIISSISNILKDQKIIWLNGICDPYKKNIPYAFFKDLISTFLGIPIFSVNSNEIKKSIKKTFETNFEITDESILNIIYRIILNEYKECHNNIDENRKEIHECIYKILSALNTKAKIVFIIEDFEYIDKASFDCIKYLLNNNFLENKNFLIINHIPSTNVARLFPMEISSQKFLMIFIKPPTNEELNAIMLSMLNNQEVLPANLKSKIFRQSNGLPVYIEQALWYLFQIKAIYSKDSELVFNPKYKNIEITSDISELFMQRFELIEKLSPEAIKIILTSALFGVKFMPEFIQKITKIENKEFQEILQLLVNNGIFYIVNQQTFKFKHLNLLKIIFKRGFTDKQLKELSSNTLLTLKETINAGSFFLAGLAENSENFEDTFNYYNNAVQESFFLGDVFSYTGSQIKLLELLPKSDFSDEKKESIELAINEQIGKVNYESNPSIAMQYLTTSIKKHEEQDNKVKLIELAGYMSRSCELAGNFQGALDCAEKAIAVTEKEKDSTEIMLLNFSKLDATFNLGRFEETIMTAQNEILPFLGKLTSKNETFPGLTVENIKLIEYETELILAKTLIFQGNIKAVEILKKIAAKAEKEKRNDYEIKALLGQALFSTIQGDIKKCENIFENLNKKWDSIGDSNQIKLQYLFITILSSMLNGNFKHAQNLCYSALPLAKECRDYNIFSLVKLLNGLFYQHFQHHKNAITIYDEVSRYCSETKMATGALYSWYFAAEAELQAGNPAKAEEIAEKALDISQKPNINNFITVILFSKLLAEIKIIKGDFEGAQINIENSIELAENNKFHYALVELYITFGKIYQENASLKEDNREYSSNYANRLYTKSLNLAEKLDNQFIITKVEKELSGLHTFSKLSGITLENVN